MRTKELEEILLETGYNQNSVLHQTEDPVLSIQNAI
jgi:hypothetical protein